MAAASSTKNPDSPHLLIPTMKAHFLFAVAENDDQREPEAKTILNDTFAKAKLPAEIEVYAGAAHGWCPPDSAVYNEKQAERPGRACWRCSRPHLLNTIGNTKRRS